MKCFREERIITRDEFSVNMAKAVLKDETLVILGYGVQGPAQALNLRDNGFQVIVGQRQNSSSWDRAVADGWKPGVTLFPLEEAAQKGTCIFYLLSDAGQVEFWPKLYPHLTSGKTVVFTHGFSITYPDQTHVIPPKDIDVVLVAPKGSGRSVRQLFLQAKGINSSYAVAQDASGKAEEKAQAIGISIGSGYLFKTTFQNETYSDLVGERGVLMGALAAMFEVQYELLRKHGHSATEAFNETVEEFTESLLPLVSEKGMDWMYSHCSTTAQRGALDWLPRFKKALIPVFDELYEQVASGKETQIVIHANSKKNYRKLLTQELKKMSEKEIWQVGKFMRSMRS